MNLLRWTRKLSLTQRVLALTLVAALPGLLALVSSAVALRNTRYAEVRAEAMRNAQFVVSELDQIFDGIRGGLHAVSQASDIDRGDRARCGSYVARARVHLEPLTSILIADADGTVRCFSESDESPPNLSDRPYFQSALASRKFTIGVYLSSRVADRHIVPMAMPIMRGGEVDGLVLAGLDLQWLSRHVRARGVAHGSAVTVADRNGIIIAREPFPERFVGTPFPPQFLQLVKAPAAGVEDVTSRDGTARILGFVPSQLTPFGFYVSAGISRAAAFAPIDQTEHTSITLFTCGTLAAVILSWLVGEGILRRPLMRIVATAQAWRGGDTAARTGIAGRKDEIGLLGHTFDTLMDENELRSAERSRAEAQREIMVHELAHRVKNNLAIVQSIAALSFRHSQGPEALRGFQDRIAALVRGHDLLTQRNWESAELSEIARAATAPVREDNAHRIAMTGPAIEMPADAAVPVALILHELCTNAVKYGALSVECGSVAIGWTVDDGDDGRRHVLLEWRERGGPPVARPQHAGFGSKLIDNLTKQMRGTCELRFETSGIVCVIDLTLPAQA